MEWLGLGFWTLKALAAMPVLLEISKAEVVVRILPDEPKIAKEQPAKSPPGVQCHGTTKRGTCRHSTLAQWTNKRDRESILEAGFCTFHK